MFHQEVWNMIVESTNVSFAQKVYLPEYAFVVSENTDMYPPSNRSFPGRDQQVSGSKSQKVNGFVFLQFLQKMSAFVWGCCANTTYDSFTNMAAITTTEELGCEIWIELHEQLPYGYWNEFSCVTKSTEVQ